MMANNWQRLNIALKLSNRFDYEQFKTACELDGCEPLSALEYGQKMGLVACGMAAYPELPVAEAYITFVQKNQTAFAPMAQTVVAANAAQIETDTVTIVMPDGTEEKRVMNRATKMLMPAGSTGQTVQSTDAPKPCCGGGRVV